MQDRQDKNTRNNQAIYRIMEQLLEVDSLEDALSGALTAIVDILHSEAGAIWLLDPKTDRLHPVFHIGPADISNISIENGFGIEGVVTKTGKALMITDCDGDPRFTGTVFDDQGLKAKSLICVPLNNMREVIGCVQIINRTDGESYDESELDLCEKMAALAAITIDEKGLSVSLPEEQKRVIIKLENVIKEFPSGEGVSRVLKGINLEIYENEFVVVLGESGCGKSTMMNIIGGMDFLTEGTLTIEGKDFSHPTDAELTEYRRNYVGFVFQAYNLMPNLTAKENIDFIAEISPKPISSEEALQMVGLLEKGGNFPAQMSGGQQQRVSIARAVVKQPKVILADEPTAALDFQTGQEVLRVFEGIVKTNGTTVLMITHNAEIAKMANRVIKLRGGKIASIKTNMHPLTADEISW
ncbi:MAG: ATP-binding cassette domain-containing protein [Clostridia bacterium]|nr:ATP-binding cassette domain-containing protein [Clostridia bacterium]